MFTRSAAPWRSPALLRVRRDPKPGAGNSAVAVAETLAVAVQGSKKASKRGPIEAIEATGA